MGQAASRQAAKQVQKTAGSSAAKSAAPAAPRPPPLGRPVADAPDVIEDAEKALQTRQEQELEQLSKPMPPLPSRPTPLAPPRNYAPPAPLPPPQADSETGFFRGQLTDPRDVSQEKFLKHQQGGKPDPQEMAPDLLKFLTDAGPLQKKVNKNLTSARIVKELETGEEGEKSEKMHRFEAAQRNRNDMRLVEGIEGHTTSRTTNFFTSTLAADAKEELSDFGLFDLEIYDLLKRSAAAAQAKKAAGGEAGSDNDICKSFFNEKAGDRIEAAGWTEEEQQQQQKLLKDTVNYLELPAIIKDEDANYIGLPQSELDVEFAHQKVDKVDESRVKLVLADLHDLGKKEIKRIR